MGALRSAIDEFRADDPVGVDDDVLEADLAELLRAADLLHAEALRRIAEVERRGSFARDGHLSVTAWLVSRFRLAWSAAHDGVRTARALGSMPHVRTAFAAGDIGRAAVATLMGASAAHPDEFARSEALLVDAARSLGVGELRQAVDHWRGAADHRSAERADDERFRRRTLHVSPTFDGMVRVDGDLDPESGQALITALRTVGDTEVRSGRGDDPRSPSQRRADALGDLPPLARPRRSSDGRRRAPTRDGDDRPSKRSRTGPEAQLSGVDGKRVGRERAPARLRRFGLARDHPRVF